MTTRYTNGLVFNAETRNFEKKNFDVQKQYFKQSNAVIETEIDLDGYYVTPGFIDSCSQIGLTEIGIRWEGMIALSLTQICNIQYLMAFIHSTQHLKKRFPMG